MRAYVAFFAKEIVESIRTYKSFVLLIIFLIFGFMNPLMAKFMPELVSSLGGEQLGLAIPEPAGIDSWTQFFKNITQLGLVVMIIMFSGILTRELNKGTLVNLLTKGLSRATVVLAKLMLLVCVWTLAYVLCALITFGYTLYFFSDSGIVHLFFSLLALWLFGVLLLCVLMLAGTLFSSNYMCLLSVGVFVVALTAISIIPAVEECNPLSLATMSTALLSGSAAPGDFLPAIIISAGLTMACAALSIVLFRKRAL